MKTNVLTSQQKSSSSAVTEKQHDASCHSLAVQYLERSVLLLVTLTSDLPLRAIKFCSVFFTVLSLVPVPCDKHDLLMCGGLCDKRTSMLSAIN